MQRRGMWAGVAVAVAVVGAGVYWFQPHKLVLDERTEEAVPEAAAPTTGAEESGPDGSAPSAGPTVLASGALRSLDHDTSGTVQVLELGDGRRAVRLEGLETSNGPDLFVYLSTTPAGGEEGKFDDDFHNLGRLKANQGDQNYELPPSVDLARFASVVIWCDRFDSAFGAADLSIA